MTYDEFEAVFRESKRAWHLELKDTYNVAGEDEPFARFLGGESDDYSWLGGWLSFIREMTDAGTAVERLRVISVPHSDYTRWGFVVAPENIKAGEEIRYIRHDAISDVELPEEDCWLFDDDILVLSVFSEDGRTGGFAHTADAELTEKYRLIRDRVWPRATPYGQYVSRL